MKKIILTLAVVAVAAMACQKDLIQDEIFLSASSGVNSPRVVGGEEINPGLPPNVLNVTDSLSNPYTISNMRLAYRNAIIKYGEPVFGNFDISDIILTHYYVKFEPETEAQLDNLIDYFKEDDITFFDYPIEYETCGEGMVEAPLIGIMPLYACIPSNITLPFFCKYTILDSIFLPDDQEGDISTLNADGVSVEAMDLLLDEAYSAVGIEDTRASTKWRPSGRIMVWDDLLNKYVPVVGVKVKAYNGLKTASGVTDENGYFSVDKTFKRAVKYTIVWENEHWDIRTGLTGQAKYHKGDKTTASWNVSFHDLSRGENYAHIHRALWYHFYGDDNGCGRVSSNKKVKVAYMNTVNNTILARFNTSLPIGGMACDIKIFGNTSGKVSRTYGESLYSQYIIGSLLHELAHASMYTILGKNAYKDVDIYLRESWAAFVSWLQTYKYYDYEGMGTKIKGNTSTSGVDKPNHFNCQDWTNYSYEETPLLIDLFDNSNQRQHAIDDKDGYVQADSTLYPNDKIYIAPTTYNVKIVKDLVYASESIDEFKTNMIAKFKALYIHPSLFNEYISSY